MEVKYNYHGITHAVPSWLLPIWKKSFCRKNIHAFDEVGGQDMNYLSCDACGLMVNIESVDTTYQAL